MVAPVRRRVLLAVAILLATDVTSSNHHALHELLEDLPSSLSLDGLGRRFGDLGPALYLQLTEVETELRSLFGWQLLRGVCQAAGRPSEQHWSRSRVRCERVARVRAAGEQADDQNHNERTHVSAPVLGGIVGGELRSEPT